MNNTHKPDFDILKMLAKHACSGEQKVALSIESSWAPYHNFLYYLASYMNPRLSVEIGVLHGLSAAHLAAGAFHSIVIGMDISFVGLDPNFKWSNVIFLEGDPLLMKWIFPPNSGIDILFIDSEHTYDVTMPQYRKFRQYMSAGGVILLDDIHLHGEMERVWAEIEEPKIELNELHDSGFGAVIV